LFFVFALVWLGALLLYQLFGSRRGIDLNQLISRPPALIDPVTAADSDDIKVECRPECYFVADGKRIKSRTDNDSAAALPKVILRFYDQAHGLIGYEDDNPNPNFFVIDTRGEFIQAIRLKLPEISYIFEAYYPSQQLIRFKSSNNKYYYYSANKPELLLL